MKKINILILGFVLMLGFNACQEDPIVTINPLAETGELGFTLNQTRYSNFVYALTEANNDLDMEALYTSQPDYGFTAAVTYYVQASFDENMTDAVELTSSVQGERVTINTKEMNQALLKLYKGEMPNPSVEKDVYVRLKAIVSEATPSPLIEEPIVKPLYSNVVKLRVLPYFMEDLKPYDEVKTLTMWYIVGSVGQGDTWKNEAAGVGHSTIPLSVVEGDMYDGDGNGTYSYTGYFTTSQAFKVIRVLGSWDVQWGNRGGAGINEPIVKLAAGDEEGSDFVVPENGYYTITMNSIENKMTIEKVDIDPTMYTSMGLTGAMPEADWGDGIQMNAFQAENNHFWWYEFTYSGDFESKFRNGDTWWGGTNFPIGLASTANAPNIPATAGTYMVMFNDIDGFYYFFKK